MSLADDLTPCTVCGKPVLWGTRHSVCGQRVMAAEALDLDQVKRIVNAKEAAQRAAMWAEQDGAGVAPSDGPNIPPDAITVNLVRLAGLDKHKARECEAIVRQVIAASGVGVVRHETFSQQTPMVGEGTTES